MGRCIRSGLFAGMLAALLLTIGPALAQSAKTPEDLSRRAEAVERDLRRQEAEIERKFGELSRVGSRLEEARAQTADAKARVAHLKRETRSLNQSLDARKREAAESRSRFEERLNAVYKGRELDGLLLLLESMFGGETTGDASLNEAATQMLAGEHESMAAYKKDRQLLSNTLRQLEAKSAQYEESREEYQARVEELERREAELERSIESLREKQGQTEAGLSDMEVRIKELEAQERAGLLDPPASGWGDRPPVPPASSGGDSSLEPPASNAVELTSDQPASGEGERTTDPPPSGETDSSPEEEALTTQEEIVVDPVEELPLSRYRQLYLEAAEDYGFGPDWYVLMAVGKIESNHGENMGPSSAGAMGPMQFMPSTWESAGVDGNGDGVANVMDPEDAIPAAAKYLADNGAPEDWYAALYAYNHAGWYVWEVMEIAEAYRLLTGDDSVGPYGTGSAPAVTSSASHAEEPPTPRNQLAPSEPAPAENTAEEDPTESMIPPEEGTLSQYRQYQY